MAIFRSDDLATKVVVDDLTLLIREAGKALLDKRLATSSFASEGSKLDEATSTQMVRAINKVSFDSLGCTVPLQLPNLISSIFHSSLRSKLRLVPRGIFPSKL
jgi:hypothetical protein